MTDDSTVDQQRQSLVAGDADGANSSDDENDYTFVDNYLDEDRHRDDNENNPRDDDDDHDDEDDINAAGDFDYNDPVGPSSVAVGCLRMILLLAVTSTVLTFWASPDELATKAYTDRNLMADQDRWVHRLFEGKTCRSLVVDGFALRPRNPTIHLTTPRERFEYILRETGKLWPIDHHADVLHELSPLFDIEEYTNPNYRDPILRAAHWLIFEDSSVTERDRLLERYALAVIFFHHHHRGRRSWHHTTNWLSPSVHECDWWGIRCGCVTSDGELVDDDSPRFDPNGADATQTITCQVIIGIDLSSNGLKGPFTQEWCIFSYLRELNLQNNPQLGVDFWWMGLSNLSFFRKLTLNGNRPEGEDSKSSRNMKRDVWNGRAVEVNI